MQATVPKNPWVTNRLFISCLILRRPVSNSSLFSASSVGASPLDDYTTYGTRSMGGIRGHTRGLTNEWTSGFGHGRRPGNWARSRTTAVRGGSARDDRVTQPD